jgi:hypothetical protein
MATIATFRPQPRTPPYSLPLREAAAQTFKAGDLVKVGANGAVSAWAAAADVGLAYAASDASGVTGALIQVYRVTAYDIFDITLTGVLAVTDLNIGYGVTVAAVTGIGNVWSVNKADTTNLRFKVVNVHGEIATERGIIGDTNARVLAVPIVDIGGAAGPGVGTAAAIWF